MTKIAVLLLVLVVNAACLLPELSAVPDLNDNVLHLTLISGMVDTIQRGGNPFDFFTPEIGLGQPIVKYYQPGAHLLVSLVYFASFKLFPVSAVFLWVRFLALALLPLTFYYAAGLLEFPQVAQVSAALLSCLVSGDSFGLDAGSYVWAGHGLFPQLVATHFFLLSIGLGWRYISRGRWLVPALFLVLTGWCNFVYGYCAAVCLVVMVATLPNRPVRSLLKVAGFGLLCFSPKLVDWFAGGQFSAGETGARSAMADSYGALKVLGDLFAGRLFDAGRLPVLTGLVIAGLCLRAYSKQVYLLAGFLVLLVLYFGRPFWGAALWLAGITPSFPLHRLIGPVQIFGVFLAALVLQFVWGNLPKGYGVLAVALILTPAIQERRDYLAHNGAWKAETAAAFVQDGPDVQRALELARARGGRAYAGLPFTWGNDFRIGAVPVCSLFPVSRIPSVGFLYVGFTPRAAAMYGFRERIAMYRDMDVRTIIQPVDLSARPDTFWLATFGRFSVYGTKI